jgi:opacity protein-like surface antigen
MRLHKIGFVSVLSLLSFQAIGDDKGFYLGAGLSNIQVNERSLDDEDSSFKVYAGYRVNGYLALEGALVDLGKFKDKDNNQDFEGKSAQIAAHIGVPFGDRLRVFGSVGAHAWDADGNAPDNNTGVNMTYGAGVELDVFRNLGIRAEYEVLEVGKIDLNQTTASAFLLF